MLADKFHNDKCHGNRFYAKVGGIGFEEMNKLEAEFLKLLNWKVFVGVDEYDRYLQAILQYDRHLSK